MSVPKPPPFALPFLLVALLTACGGGVPTPMSPSPAQIPSLESQLEDRPDDAAVLWRLGAAHRAAGELDRAIPLLERAVSVDPDLPEARFFLGIAYEEAERLSEAIDAYAAYQEMGGPGAESLDGRLRLLRREQMRRDVRAALAREAELAGTPPRDNTLAVFPFRFAAEDESLSPLSYALADMLVTDLSQTDRLQVLERVQVQTLVDELALSESGLVDPATARRGGRIVGAGQVVQGRIRGSMATLGLDASVVSVGSGGAEAPVTVEDAAIRLLDMEKELAFAIYDELGVSLTPAERERVSDRPTENLQALLAYGMGLRAADLGDFGEAQEHFRRAASLDPSFSLAASRAQESETMGEAEDTPPAELTATQELDLELDDLVPPTLIERDPAAEILGTEGVGGATILEIVIRGSGGGS